VLVLVGLAAALPRGAALSALVAGVAAVGSIATFHALWLGPHDADAYPTGRTIADVADLRDAEVIAWGDPGYGGYGPYTFGQFFAPRARIDVIPAGGRPAAGTDVVIGPQGWAPEPGWVRTADNPSSELELWVPAAG
jgi:hypothetical protein